jgi:hypothetical protein
MAAEAEQAPNKMKKHCSQVAQNRMFGNACVVPSSSLCMNELNSLATRQAKAEKYYFLTSRKKMSLFILAG